MRNIVGILKRDFIRLLKSPAAMLVIAALLVLPSFYAWYNIAAFWHPYECTGNLPVAVVNQDIGTDNKLTGKLNVGDRVVDELSANENLKFVPMDYTTSMDQLMAGKIYAAYVIPEDFSECLISPLTGQIKGPHIAYYVNEKVSPVSPKVTDQAATTIEETINAAFVQEVSNAAVGALEDVEADVEGKLGSSQSSAARQLDDAVAFIDEVEGKIDELKSTTAQAKEKIATAKGALDKVLQTTADSRAVLDDVSVEADAVQNNLLSMADSSVSSLSTVLADVSKVTSSAASVADGTFADTGNVLSRVDLAVSGMQPAVTALSDVSSDLQKVADALPSDSSIKGRMNTVAQDATARVQQMQGLVDNTQSLNGRLNTILQNATNTTSSLVQTTNQTTVALQEYSQGLYNDIIPTITSTVTQVNSTTAQLSAALTSLDSTVKQTQACLSSLENLLGNCEQAADQTGVLVKDFEDDLKGISADINLLKLSSALTDIEDFASMDSQNVGAFMANPTELTREPVYTVNAYGTAMAPLFMNIALWVGAFMLIIIFRLEVDDEGLVRVTPTQRYIARFIMLSVLAIIQGLICCAGVFVIGVEAVNVPAFFGACAMSSFAYFSIIFALSMVLQHIGKALCIILVFAQIPGGTGLYPLELTDPFFQSIYPLFPFTYGTGAMREAISGFYDSYYLNDLGMLALMMLTALVAGAALVPLMSNVTRMSSREIKESDLFNGEDVVASERPFSLMQVAHALADREDFRTSLQQRYERFSRYYPKFIRISVVLGLGIPIAGTLLLTIGAAEKVVILTLFLIWLVGMMVLLVVVETQRYSLEQQLNIDHMSDEHLMTTYFNRHRMTKLGAQESSVSTTAAAAVSPAAEPAPEVATLPVDAPSTTTEDAPAAEPADLPNSPPADPAEGGAPDA